MPVVRLSFYPSISCHLQLKKSSSSVTSLWEHHRCGSFAVVILAVLSGDHGMWLGIMHSLRFPLFSCVEFEADLMAYIVLKRHNQPTIQKLIWIFTDTKLFSPHSPTTSVPMLQCQYYLHLFCAVLGT